LNENDKKFLKNINDFVDKFEQSMNDDFNTPLALSTIFDFVNKSNKYFEENPNPNKFLCAFALSKLMQLGQILTLFQPSLVEKKEIIDKEIYEKLVSIVKKYDEKVKSKNIEDLLEKILDLREKARVKKDFKTSDNIRKDLQELGFEIQDTIHGPVWRKR
ncbi:MAG: hypothetical protein QHH15_07210, partial [Candidatus Thermoplasmatota archaeon]|nr:hypothetical protein [Candidatus Thermoplasmatota archaeon]